MKLKIESSLSVLAYLIIGVVWGFSLAYIDEGIFLGLRSPAAINFKQAFDYSHLSGTALHDAIRKRVLGNLQIQKSEQSSGFALGNFVFITPKGEKMTACLEYSQVKIVMIADGESVNGRSPTVEMVGSCKTSEDMATIRPLLLPISALQKEPSNDSEFIFEDQNNLYVKFRDINQQWPKRWVVKSIELKKENSQGSLIFEQNEIKETLGRLPVMMW